MIPTKLMWEAGIGDHWFQKNLEDMGKFDGISEVLEELKIEPKVLLEVGCANGWRLKKLQQRYGCTVCGIDPSRAAIEAAHKSGLSPDHIILGTADKLEAPDQSFDMVIFGFCLCFIAPEDWQAMVSETNRVLKEGGYIVVLDFINTCQQVRYCFEKADGMGLKGVEVFIYLYDWPSLWTAHPGYKVIHETFFPANFRSVSVIQKNYADIFKNNSVIWK